MGIALLLLTADFLQNPYDFKLDTVFQPQLLEFMQCISNVITWLFSPGLREHKTESPITAQN